MTGSDFLRGRFGATATDVLRERVLTRAVERDFAVMGALTESSSFIFFKESEPEGRPSFLGRPLGLFEGVIG